MRGVPSEALEAELARRARRASQQADAQDGLAERQRALEAVGFQFPLPADVIWPDFEDRPGDWADANAWEVRLGTMIRFVAKRRESVIEQAENWQAEQARKPPELRTRAAPRSWPLHPDNEEVS